MLELSQVQSNVLRGFRQGEAPKHVAYLFLHFSTAQAVRAMLLGLCPQVTTCAAYDAEIDERDRKRSASLVECPTTTLNVGLAYPCLELLGLGGDARALDERDTEATGAIEAFKCGMKARAALLGDRGPSAPSNWEPAYQRELHAVISLSGPDRASFTDLLERVKSELAAMAGVELVHQELGAHFDGEQAKKEHFGFSDGISQPTVLGAGLSGYPGDGTPGKRRGWDPIQPGEFVLGQIDESGQIQFGSPLFKHGSFMVFRKLAQDVGLFREYTQALASKRGVSPELIGAKMIGRWPSGAPLVESPRHDNERLGANPEKNNDFRYADDPEGERCPFGAHIRRTNPREDPTGPLTPQTKLHRVIRRATPYGEWLPEGQADDGKARGMLFVAINADISRQFEFVQQHWVDGLLSSTRLTLPADRDPVIATQTADAKFLMPSSGRKSPPIIAWDLPSFVTTRGGAYFLLPSVDALYDIAHGIRWPGQDDPCGSGELNEDGTCKPSSEPATIEPEPATIEPTTAEPATIEPTTIEPTTAEPAKAGPSPSSPPK